MGRIVNGSIAVVAALLLSTSSHAEKPGNIYAAVSPAIANTFWRDLNELSEKGVRITPEIADQVCASKVVGDYRQCRKIRVTDPVPIKYVQGYAIAIRDGEKAELLGEGEAWMTVEYYIYYMNLR